jgi:hypothetical protein
MKSDCSVVSLDSLFLAARLAVGEAGNSGTVLHT